jgi:heme-degrading monooxygenase HmoA
MIARIWRGAVPLSKSDEYLKLMRTGALRECMATQGNQGVLCLHHADGDAKRLQVLTFWQDTEAIKCFAGPDHSLAKYYDFEWAYLVEGDVRALHYEVYSHASSNPLRATDSFAGGQSNTIARVWRGAVPIEKAEAYLGYLAGFGFRDYEAYAGYRGAYLLRLTEEARVHIVLLSLWNSRQAIVAYAGAEIEQAHYYAYDLECLIDPGPNVEHYEVLSGLTPTTD